MEVEEGSFETSAGVKPIRTFEGMDLKPGLLKGIIMYGLEKPSAIQQRAIIPIKQRRDVIAQSQSGTGKTSMMAIAAIEVLETNVLECGSELCCLLERLKKVAVVHGPTCGPAELHDSWR